MEAPDVATVVATVIAGVALIVAVASALYVRSQANAAWESAGDARLQSTAAKEAVTEAREQTTAARKAIQQAEEQTQAALEQVYVARKSLEAEERARYEARQPYVVVDIRPSDDARKIYNLVIENIGTTVARDVKITWDPPIHRAPGTHDPFPLSQIRPFTHGISTLPPGASITTFFATGLKIPSFEEDMFTATVSARGPDDTVETHRYEIDIRLRQSLMYASTYTSQDAFKFLEKLSGLPSEVRELRRVVEDHQDT